MAAIDISARMRKMREKIPPKDRSVGTMKGVAKAADAYAQQAEKVIWEQYTDQAIDAIWQLPPGHLVWAIAQLRFFNPQAELLMRQLDEIRQRVHKVYLPILEELPDEAPMPKSVYPLFYNVPGERWMGRMFFMPDCLGPANVLNQWGELAAVNRDLIGAFWPTYFDTLVEVAKEKGGDVVDAVEGPITTALVVVAGIAALGVLGYGVTRGYKEGSQ